MSKLFATIIVTAMLLCTMTMMVPAKAAPPSPPAFWVIPETDTFYTSTTPVGTLFNVTVWVATTAAQSFSWQVKLAFNASQLQAVDGTAKYTGGSQSQWFVSAGANSTVPLPAQIDNLGGTVLVAESLLTASDYIPPSSGSLFFVTFNVTATPPQGATLSSVINTATYAPDDTLVQDVDLFTELGFNYGNCTYSLIYASATPPTIEDPTQVPPMDAVNVSQSVLVSANVTDNSGTGLKNVTLSYSTDNVTFYSAPMALNATTGLWDGTIPGYAKGTTVYYNILAYDNAGNHAVNSNTGNWNYGVIPEFTSLLIIVMLFAMASAVLLMRKKIVH